MQIQPINTKRIYQNIIEQFIGLIKSGTLKVGDRLPAERILAELFHVSRASIREAFSAMEIIGLIEVRPGEGSFITNLNIGPFINTISPLLIQDDKLDTDLLEFRKLIELEGVTLVAQKQDQEKAVKLEKSLDMMEEAVETNNMVLGEEADMLFHQTLFELTENNILIKAAECISCLVQSSIQFNRSKILRDIENAKTLLTQHKAIYQAIVLGDPTTASDLMKKHLDYVKTVV